MREWGRGRREGKARKENVLELVTTLGAVRAQSHGSLQNMLPSGTSQGEELGHGPTKFSPSLVMSRTMVEFPALLGHLAQGVS